MASTQCFLHHHALTTTTPTRVSPQRQIVNIKPNLIVCKAQNQEADAVSAVSRRLALSVLFGAAAVASKVSPADAAYGEAANVFGKPKTDTDFLPYNGDGFKLIIPSKWNPSKEREYPGQVLRYEDNFDATSNVSVTVTDTDKKSITDYGSPEEFLSKVDYLLGKQAFFGQTDSEVLSPSTSIFHHMLKEWIRCIHWLVAVIGLGRFQIQAAAKFVRRRISAKLQC